MFRIWYYPQFQNSTGGSQNVSPVDKGGLLYSQYGKINDNDIYY